MLLAQLIATKNIDIEDEKNFNFIVLDTELNTGTTYLELVHNLGVGLRTNLAKRVDLKTVAKNTWDFLSKWSILGVEYKTEEKNKSCAEAISELASTVCDFLKGVDNKIDGILILIDEADKANPSIANLGEFVKILTEKLTKAQCDRVCLILAGLPILIEKLREGHESSLRVFETHMLEPLSKVDSEKVVTRALKEAKEKNKIETTIESDALDAITHLADGYPHFIHEFGYCAFDADQDNNISLEDVLDGAFKANGAIDQLGKKYFHQMYFDKVSSADYREVLNVMAEKSDEWIARSDIIRDVKIKESQVNNALLALKDRDIILANKERKGEYRLPTKSFAVWIKANIERKKSEETGG